MSSLRTLHLARGPAGPVAAMPHLADRDWLVYLEGTTLRLARLGAPPFPAGPIDHDQLVVLITAADRVITW